MKKSQLNTPILFIAFNRPDITKIVFDEIKKVRPKKLFVSVDGPRNEIERQKVEKVKKIVSDIDWLCEVKKKFNRKNLGCRKAVSSAMTWFFNNVDEGIVLEDDCLPSKDFFKFCEEILARYRDDERIMHISGNNFLGNLRKYKYSYYFSKYPFSWGWASWRRAWKKYDVDMKLYPKIKIGDYLKNFSFLEKLRVKSKLKATYKGLEDTWDYQWFFSLLINKGLAIVPKKNLVKNIGFREDSTHTKPIDSYLSVPTENMDFPLKHPSHVKWDKEADKKYFKRFFWKRAMNVFLRKTNLIKIFRF